MPSSSSRSRVPVRRSPRPAPRAANAVATARERPQAVPFAAVFGLLLTVEVLYLGWLVWEPEPAFDRFLVIPLVLAVAAATGSVLVLQGRRRGWAVLAVAAVAALFVLSLLVFLLGALGGGGAMWAAALLLAGPLAALVLSLRRSVREWCGSGRARRSPGGRRSAGSSR
jgi:hypothetical protein